MHTNKPEPTREVITTRELADAIDELICLRAHAEFPDVDRIEMVKRRIADGLKDHSGSKGVYKDNPGDRGHQSAA